MFGVSTSLPLAPSAAVILPLPSARPSIERIQVTELSSQFKNFLKIAPTFIDNSDKIVLTEKQIEQFDLLSQQVIRRSITIDEAILQIRGGYGLTDIAAVIAFVIFINWLDGANSFQVNLPPHLDPMGWLQGSYNHPKTGSSSKSPTSLQITRPTTMPHQEFVGLTKEKRRQLPDSKDMKLNHEGHPELTVGFWQSKFKVGNHGEVHGLEYTVKNNGGTKTEKTDENALKMMRSIVDMPNRENVQWFDDGMYQGGTDREFDAIHIYDKDNQVIAVFKKATGKFVTTCRLTDLEDEELMKTGNFGGGKDCCSGKVKNLPLASPENNLGTTPIDKSSPITPVNSFKSDIMGVTPIDNSQIDNP